MIPFTHFQGIILSQDLKEGFEMLENQQFAQAEDFFQKILETYPENRTARLCYGRAVGLGGDPDLSITLFDTLLQDYPDDKEIHINLAESYLWAKKNRKAVQTYQMIVDANPQTPLPRVGLSVAHYLLGNNRKSDYQIIQAMSLLTDQTDPNIAMGVRMQSLQSLLWQNKFTEVESLSKQYLEEDLITQQMSNTIIARSALRQKDYLSSLWKYNQLINENRKSSEAWAGRVQSLMAMDSLGEAYKTAISGATSLSTDKSLKLFAFQIESQWTPSINIHYWYNYDSGNSTAQNAMISTTIPSSKKLAFSLTYRYRGTRQDSSNASADLQNLALGINYRIAPHLTISGQLGAQFAMFELPSTDRSAILNSAVELKRKQKKYDFKVGYKSGLQDYNTALLSVANTQHDFYVSYNYNSLKGLGLYSKIDYNFYSDKNRSTFGYLSLYHRIKRIPFIKSGINLQYLAFNIERPSVYFSPDQFYAAEAFIDIVRSADMVTDKGITYLLTVAGGTQIINEISNNNIFENKTYRVNASLGYKFNHRVMISAYGLQSNVASATIQGFTYSEFGLRAGIPLAKKPQFTVD